MDPSSLIPTAVGIIFGGLISIAASIWASWFFGVRYYRRASEDLITAADTLRHEAQMIERLVEIQTELLRDAGVIDCTRNDAGQVVGVRHRGLEGNQPAATATLTAEYLTRNRP